MKDDISYYQSLDDYEDIKEYLDTTPIVVTDEELPKFVPDFGSAIVVDNIPAVPKEKVGKLMSVLLKIYVQISKITEQDIQIPFNEEAGLTHGFCFVKFHSKEEAEQAVKVTQGLAIDKNHSFVVNLYSDLEKFGNMPDEYKPPVPPEFRPRPDPTEWLTDSACRDQFVIRATHDTEIFWANNTPGDEPSLVYGGEREKSEGKVWCDSYVSWSPQGTYLATFHTPGIKLWGGGDFSAQGKFMHQKVEELSFSPCEKYLVTYRYSYIPELDPAEAIVVWDIRSGRILRSFELKNPLDAKFQVQATVIEEKTPNKRVERVIRGRVKSYEGDAVSGYFTIEEGNTTHEKVPSDKVMPLQEPNRFKWSSDGKYIARLGCDILSVYELPSMNLIDRKSIAAKDCLDFSWSPRSNMISFWSPANGNYPAQINIINIPERKEICSRKLVDVTDGRMVWQNDGNYLCVYTTKVSGKKKSYVLMFFRVCDPSVPVEQLELTEPILNVSWEPSGDKVVIMSGEVRSPTIAFYTMASAAIKSGTTVAAVATGVKTSAAVAGKNELTHLFTKTGSQCSEMLWSPAGNIIALAYFASDACVFELLDVEQNVTFATRRHNRCTRLYWDPSGRFIVSCTITELRNAHVKGQPEDGFNVYTFQGVPVVQVKREKLFQFSWRPRPKDLLSSEEKKKVVKNLKKYEKLFDKEDRQRKQELDQELQATRYEQAEKFLSWFNRNRAQNAQLKSFRIALRDGYDSDDERNYRVEVTVS